MRAEYKKAVKLIVAILVLVGVLGIIVNYLSGRDIAVLEPKGTIAHQERNLILLTLGLCAIVVIPVFALTIGIALKYREGNSKKVKYSPDWDHDRRIETAWWGVPFAIISVLAIVAWVSSYNLDPYKALASSTKPLDVQVIALDWKWLFIYPKQNIATVNYLRIPLNTPIAFSITSDSVMNSFWIPDLGSQIYAMPGMSTELNLSADKIGSYHGSSANISGRGFADMGFTATASTPSDFNDWVASVKRSSLSLNVGTYNQLAKPSTSGPVYYFPAQSGIYESVVMKYMMPAYQTPDLIGGLQ